MNNISQFPNDSFNSKRKGGDGGGNLEPRVAKLEAGVEYIQRDIADIKGDIKELRTDIKEARKESRQEFYVLISFMIGLLGVMAKGFGWL